MSAVHILYGYRPQCSASYLHQSTCSSLIPATAPLIKTIRLIHSFMLALNIISTERHRLRTQNKVRELQEYQSGNHIHTHTHASDICRQLVPWQLAANWIIVWKGESSSEGWRKKKRKERGKLAEESKQEINETNRSHKTAVQGDTLQGKVLQIYVFSPLCKKKYFYVKTINCTWVYVRWCVR